MTTILQKTTVYYGSGAFTPGRVFPDDRVYFADNMQVATDSTQTVALLALTNDLRRNLTSGVDDHQLYEREWVKGKRSITPPFIYEKTLASPNHARIRMIELAYAADTIYSISFRPKDPAITQTWFFRKGVASARHYSEDSEVYVEGALIERLDESTELREGTEVSGFLNPYSGYRSKKYQPDGDLRTIQPVFLESADDIGFNDIQPPALQESVVLIAREFLKDEGATAVALVLLQDPVRRVLLEKPL